VRCSQVPIRFLTVAVTAVALATSAGAYSREAAEDAYRLARVTFNRSAQGLATKADTALAQYNYLTMQYKAGQMSFAAYCRAAQPSLQIVAAGFDVTQYRHPGEAAAPSSQQSAALQKAWQDDVAGMQDSQPKCRAANAKTERLVFGAIEDESAEDAVKTASAELAIVENTTAGGTTTITQLAVARLDLLHAQYRAKQVSAQGYCDAGRKIATEMQNLVRNAEDDPQQAVQPALADVIAAKRHIFQIKALCHG
jgi:hypothetical protein